MKLSQVLKSTVLVACLLSLSNASPAVAALPSGMEMVKIPAGSFVLGSPSSESSYEYERPTHLVTISQAFALQSTEVAQGQWKALMSTAPSKFSSYGAHCPTDKVSLASACGPNIRPQTVLLVLYNDPVSTQSFVDALQGL